MEERLGYLERSHRRLKLYAMGITLLLLLVLLLVVSNRPSESQILRARGLVLVDEAGNERILIGAPIPEATNRVRTDPNRVAEIWGRRFPKEYAEWYKEYNHTTNGLLILDEQGFDRIALGDPVPDPNIGKRIAPSTGIAINDNQGFERSGYGLVDFGETKHVTLGLDTDKGTEGLILTVRDNGGSGILVSDNEWLGFLGSAPAGFFGSAIDEPVQGVLLRDSERGTRRFTTEPVAKP